MDPIQTEEEFMEQLRKCEAAMTSARERSIFLQGRLFEFRKKMEKGGGGAEGAEEKKENSEP